MSEKNSKLIAKYAATARFYDLLDAPWEYFFYRKWRPELLKNVHGKVLEAGVGTGRNLPYYVQDVDLTGVELSTEMIQWAHKRAKRAKCSSIRLLQQDVCAMDTNIIATDSYDWVISTFLCCVMPNELQPLALDEFSRVLKPGGKFKILEIVYSQNPKIRARQEFMAPYVEKVFGARFDRNTLSLIKAHPKLQINNLSYLKDDTYLLIEGSSLS